MAIIRKIQYNTTRPTSVAIMLLLFQLVKLFVHVSPEVEDFIYNAITVIGSIGIVEKFYYNRKILFNRVMNILKREKHGN